MTNLGYVQLKGLPGAWILRVAEGRHRQLYQFADGKVQALPSPLVFHPLLSL